MASVNTLSPNRYGHIQTLAGFVLLGKVLWAKNLNAQEHTYHKYSDSISYKYHSVRSLTIN
ncbi:MAG: hypothetical protein RIS73_977 [Bacteroidota bacterium]